MPRDPFASIPDLNVVSQALQVIEATRRLEAAVSTKGSTTTVGEALRQAEFLRGQARCSRLYVNDHRIQPWARHFLLSSLLGAEGSLLEIDLRLRENLASGTRHNLWKAVIYAFERCATELACAIKSLTGPDDDPDGSLRQRFEFLESLALATRDQLRTQARDEGFKVLLEQISEHLKQLQAVPQREPTPPRVVHRDLKSYDSVISGGGRLVVVDLAACQSLSLKQLGDVLHVLSGLNDFVAIKLSVQTLPGITGHKARSLTTEPISLRVSSDVMARHLRAGGPIPIQQFVSSRQRLGRWHRVRAVLRPAPILETQPFPKRQPFERFFWSCVLDGLNSTDERPDALFAFRPGTGGEMRRYPEEHRWRKLAVQPLSLAVSQTIPRLRRRRPDRCFVLPRLGRDLFRKASKTSSLIAANPARMLEGGEVRYALVWYASRAFRVSTGQIDDITDCIARSIGVNGLQPPLTSPTRRRSSPHMESPRVHDLQESQEVHQTSPALPRPPEPAYV